MSLPPNPGAFKQEISQLTAQEKSLSAMKESLGGAISALKNKKQEIEGNLNQLYNQLEGLPEQYKQTVHERIDYLKEIKNNLEQQLAEHQAKLGELGQAQENIRNAIAMREQILVRFAGAMAEKEGIAARLANREVGRVRG